MKLENIQNITGLMWQIIIDLKKKKLQDSYQII